MRFTVLRCAVLCCSVLSHFQGVSQILRFSVCDKGDGSAFEDGLLGEGEFQLSDVTVEVKFLKSQPYRQFKHHICSGELTFEKFLICFVSIEYCSSGEHSRSESSLVNVPSKLTVLLRAR